MRLSTATIFEQAVSAMQRQQTKVSNTQLQLANGTRILAPEDDPTGSARVLDLNRQIATVNQHQSNIGAARARLNLEDSTLQSVTNVLQRVRELTVQGANGTLNSSDRQAIAQEVGQLRDQLLGLANTQDANGEYIFSGYQGDVPAYADAGGGSYVYQGDQGTRTIQIAPDRQIADGDNGFDVFGNIRSSLDPSGYRNVLDTVTKLASALNGTAAPPDDNISNYLGELDNAMTNIQDVNARVGARLNALDEQDQVHQSFLVTLQGARSKVQDLDYNAAVSSFQQQLTALQASQQSFVKIQDLSLFKML